MKYHHGEVQFLYDEAIRCYQRAVELKPDYHQAWNNMGSAYDEKGDYDQAIRCYQQAVEIKPELHEAWYNLARVHAKNGDAEGTAEQLTKAIEVNPVCRQWAKTDKNFDAVRNHPAIKVLLEGE